MKAPDYQERDRFVSKSVATTLADLGTTTLDEAIDASKRRAAPQRAALVNQSLRLERDSQGLLRWRIGPQPPIGPGREALRKRAGLRRAPLKVSPALSQTLFEKLEPSDIGRWLKLADRKLSRPAWNETGQLWGLRRLYQDGRLVPFGPDQLPNLAGKNVLLFIHGTFSDCDAVMKGLGAAPNGPALFSAAFKKYDYILCFDHPTLSMSPALNAFDLASRFANGIPASLDLVAHSRGGLVVRWFCEGFRQPSLPCRAILVGAPLAGTSLASPAQVRSVMDFLANTGDAVGMVSGAVGGVFLSFAAILAGLFAKVTGTLSTPLADAVIALVPGLSAQSREGGNVELRALRINTGTFDFDDPASPVQYHSILSNFAPVEDGAWGFLKSFITRPGASLIDATADAIFNTDNDLVVDTASMIETGEIAGKPKLIANLAHDFGDSKRVHHLNYFKQRETVSAIRRTLGF